MIRLGAFRGLVDRLDPGPSVDDDDSVPIYA